MLGRFHLIFRFGEAYGSFGAQPDCGTGAVIGHVAAAEDQNVLPDRHRASQPHGAQEFKPAQHARSGSAFNRKPDAGLRAAAPDCSVKADQLFPAADFSAAFQTDPGREQKLNVGVQILFRQPVFRQAVAQHAAGFRHAFKHRYLIAFPLQEPGGTQAAGSGPDDGNRFPVRRQALQVGQRPGGADCRKALQRADGDRRVNVPAAALFFAEAHADIAQGTRERGALHHSLQGKGVLPRAEITDVLGDVNVGRAGVGARDQHISLAERLGKYALLVSQRPGGADFDAGAAEAAVGIKQGCAFCNNLLSAVGIIGIRQRRYLSDIVTGADTAPACNTAVHVTDNQRICQVDRETSRSTAQISHSRALPLNQHLEFAFQILWAGIAVINMARKHQLYRRAADMFQFFRIADYG